MTQFFCQKIIDITIPLDNQTTVYPGNPQVSITPILTKSGINISKITLGSHSGTHIDAPKHVFDGGFAVEGYNLNQYIGLCRVLDLTSCGERIDIKDLAAKKIIKGERILLKTKNLLPESFSDLNDDVFLSGNSAKYLADLQIMLLGIDSLSVKEKNTSDNTPHTALLEKGIVILEGLDLTAVSEGTYFLVVLPLKLTGLDAAPARAVLFSQT